MTNDELDKIAPNEARRTQARALEALTDVFHRMPFGQQVALSDGQKAVIKPFVEPREKEDTVEFGFDVAAIDGSWHLEFMVRKTGWGAAPAQPLTMSQEQLEDAGFEVSTIEKDEES